jgi:hypothetical protein
MVVTLNLPPDVERAFKGAADARGLSLEEFLSEVVLSSAEQVAEQPGIAGPRRTRIEFEDGVPVLRTGHAMESCTIDETLEKVRREREHAVLRPSN